jgi:hypothetical protein
MVNKADVDFFIEKILEFEETSSRLSILDNFSNFFTDRRKTFDSLKENASSDFKEIALSFEDLIEKFLFVTLVNRRKIDGINSLIKFSLNSKNPIALAQGIRALMEHACILSLLANEIEKLKTGLEGQNELIKIKEILTKSEKFIFRCYFGKSSKVESDKSKQALHTNDGLAVLKKKLPHVISDYDFLCEFVHPNHGSNLLVSISEVEKYLTQIESNFDRNEVVKMVLIGSRILDVIVNEEAYVYSLVGILGTISNRFFLDGAKLKNIFSVRKPIVQGDGKTKDSALFVSNARDVAEEIEFIYRHFDKNGFKIFGRKVDSMSTDYVFDLFNTNKGEIWVKVSFDRNL